MEKSPRGEEAQEKEVGRSPHVVTVVGRGSLVDLWSGYFYLNVLFISCRWEGHVRTLTGWRE